MSYVFKAAVREACPLLIGLVGPSGCGKTFSALRLASGIQKVRGGNIVFVDTEARRALHYADDFKFTHCEFKEPFGSLDYVEVIKAASKESKEGVVIVDSMSHEHEGMGGYLMFHDAECQRLGKGDDRKAEAAQWRAWAKPAAARQLLINTILQIPAAFIFCFRAKEKSAMVKKSGGGYEIVTLGWQAIAGDAFVFEQTVRCLLPAGCEGVPDWSAEGREHGVPKCPEALKPIMLNNRQLDERHGEELALWAAGKTKTSAKPAEAAKPSEPRANAQAGPASPAKTTEPASSAGNGKPVEKDSRLVEWKDKAIEADPKNGAQRVAKAYSGAMLKFHGRKFDELTPAEKENVIGTVRMVVEAMLPMPEGKRRGKLAEKFDALAEKATS